MAYDSGAADPGHAPALLSRAFRAALRPRLFADRRLIWMALPPVSKPIPACAGVTYPAINRRPAIVKINEINPRRGMCVLLSALVGYQLNRSRWI